MNEERVHTKRPPSASADIVDRAPAKRPTEVVTARFGPEEMDDLAQVQDKLRESRSEALRSCVGFVAAALRSSSLGKVERTLNQQLASRRPVVVDVDESLLRELMDEVQKFGEAQRQRSFQVQRLGGNHNQMVMLGNAGRVVDPDAVAAVARELAELTAATKELNPYGAKLREVVTWLSSRS